MEGLAKADRGQHQKASGRPRYHRARQLQEEAARVILHNHAGVVPDDPRRSGRGSGVDRRGDPPPFCFTRPPNPRRTPSRRLARLLASRLTLKTSASQARLWMKTRLGRFARLKAITILTRRSWSWGRPCAFRKTRCAWFAQFHQEVRARKATSARRIAFRSRRRPRRSAVVRGVRSPWWLALKAGSWWSVRAPLG